MADEAERAQLQLEVPDHHRGVEAPGHELLHVRIERDRGHRILVPAEGALE